MADSVGFGRGAEVDVFLCGRVFYCLREGRGGGFELDSRFNNVPSVNSFFFRKKIGPFLSGKVAYTGASFDVNSSSRSGGSSSNRKLCWG